MINIFFSYSHRDEALRDELEIHLSMLKREGTITAWHDRKIDAGSEFDKEISNYLSSSDIVLLLVSPYFLASDYCYDIEMSKALEMHEQGKAIVVPIILESCDWRSSPFRKLAALPTDGKPVSNFKNKHDAFLDITNSIRKVANKAISVKHKKKLLLKEYLIKERKKIFNETPPGTTILHVEDIVRNSNLYINTPWKNELGVRKLTKISKYIIDNISNNKSTLLLGNPGQGKTTVIKKIFTILTDNFIDNDRSVIPIYIPLRDISYSTEQCDGSIKWLWKHLRDKPLSSFPITYNYFNYLINNKKLIILFDGFDEIKGEITQLSINNRIDSHMFSYISVISCRTNFYDLYLSSSSINNKFPYIFKLLHLEFNDSLRRYISEYFKISGTLIEENTINKIQNSEKLSELIKTPLLLVMILDIFSDEPDKLNSHWSMLKLYNEYTNKWLINEASKAGSQLTWEEKSFLMDYIAWELYNSHGPSYYAYSVYQSVSFTYSDLSIILNKYLDRLNSIPLKSLLDDICRRTFLIGNNENSYYFIHKSFQEYYIARYIFKSLSDNYEAVSQVMKEFIPVEIATFTKQMAKTASIHIRKKIVNNLINAYNHNEGNSPDSIAIREHAAFYLAHQELDEAILFLENALKNENNKCVQRSIRVGLSLYTNRKDILEDYINILLKYPEAISINIGYHLVYYGDQPLEEGFYDKGDKLCDGTLRELFRHLSDESYQGGWVLDILTLRTLLETRGLGILTNNIENHNFITNFLKTEHDQTNIFHQEKDRLCKVLINT